MAASRQLGTQHAGEKLSRIESEAAEPNRKRVEGKGQLNPAEQQWVAFFLHVQRQRTPQSRAWHAFVDEQMHTEMMKAKLGSPEFIRRVLKEKGDSRTEDEIEKWRIETLAGLEAGTIGVESGQNREIAMIFLSAAKIVPALTEVMTLRAVRPPRGPGLDAPSPAGTGPDQGAGNGR